MCGQHACLPAEAWHVEMLRVHARGEARCGGQRVTDAGVGRRVGKVIRHNVPVAWPRRPLLAGHHKSVRVGRASDARSTLALVGRGSNKHPTSIIATLAQCVCASNLRLMFARSMLVRSPRRSTEHRNIKLRCACDARAKLVRCSFDARATLTRCSFDARPARASIPTSTQTSIVAMLTMLERYTLDACTVLSQRAIGHQSISIQ